MVQITGELTFQLPTNKTLQQVSSIHKNALINQFHNAAICSLGLVLPPYNEYYIQADLSDVMLQLQCKYFNILNSLRRLCNKPVY